MPQRQTRQILAVDMQEIECEEHNRMGRVCRTMLERLKRRTSVRVHRDDLTVHDSLGRCKSLSQGGYERIIFRQILIIPRADLNPWAILQQQCSISVVLDLVRPFITRRQRLHETRRHWLDKPR
jgi:hypothetical protein